MPGQADLNIIQIFAVHFVRNTGLVSKSYNCDKESELAQNGTWLKFALDEIRRAYVFKAFIERSKTVGVTKEIFISTSR